MLFRVCFSLHGVHILWTRPVNLVNPVYLELASDAWCWVVFLVLDIRDVLTPLENILVAFIPHLPFNYKKVSQLGLKVVFPDFPN